MLYTIINLNYLWISNFTWENKQDLNRSRLISRFQIPIDNWDPDSQITVDAINQLLPYGSNHNN